jgi:antagonist of KipI
MLTTIQDLGRRGYQASGVPVAGPMDWYSHRAANALVGNDPSAAALEITLIGPELVAEGEATVALWGADFSVDVDGVNASTNRPVVLRSGARLRMGGRRSGARAALAVRGGLDVPPLFGSRATHLASAMGPFGGRPLTAGDRLPIAAAASLPRGRGSAPLAAATGGARVRIVPAVHRERFTDDAWRGLTGERFVISPQSNRMGYRLDGPALRQQGDAEMLSEGMVMGAIQVPPAGQPILLMADCQTTGGYPTIADVITADLPIAGQLAPGDWIEFAPCSHADALEALRERKAGLGCGPLI